MLEIGACYKCKRDIRIYKKPYRADVVESNDESAFMMYGSAFVIIDIINSSFYHEYIILFDNNRWYMEIHSLESIKVEHEWFEKIC